MEFDPIILDSAYRHGVTEEAMLHALRFPVRHFVQDDSMTMFIGPDETGTLVEVGGSSGTVTSLSHTPCARPEPSI